MAVVTELRDTGAEPATTDPTILERKGRRWLIWSFVFCPCHLPISMAVLAAIFGGTAIGSLISRNTLGVGLAFGIVYATGVGIGFRHLRSAAAERNCDTGGCTVPDDPALGSAVRGEDVSR